MKKKLAVTLLAFSALCTGLTLAACGEKGPTGDGGEPGGDAQGHVHELTYVAAVEATCTEAGSLEYWTCSGCGKNFADEGATEELSDITVPATGHTEGEPVRENEVAAKCEEAGSYEEVVYCTVCETELSRETKTIPATGHTPGEAATCTEPQTCTVCDEVIAPAKGHTEGKPVRENEVAAKCEEAGSYEEVVYCTVCETELSCEIKTIPATGHQYENGYCVDCGEKELIPSEGLVYTLSEDGKSYSVTGYEGTDVDVYIPATYEGLPVTSIGDYAFYDCSLTSISIPNSVTSVGNRAFFLCDSLTSISIPDSVTSIGDSAFFGTAYYNNEQNWEDGVLYIGKYLVEADSDLSGEYTIKEGTTLIADSAFSWCGSLTSVTIGDGVTSIGEDAFAYCESLTSITIPDSVTSIGEYAFYYCSSLTSVTIPDSVTSIGDSAFRGCGSLTSITIPDSVTSIGDSAFYDCGNLTSITIPNSVTSIGDSAFFGTAYYNNEQNWEDGVLYLGKYLIAADRGLSDDYTIKDGTALIADGAFYWRFGLTSINIPDSVTSIGDRAFADCVSLTSVTIGDGVTSIGEGAFYGTAYYDNEQNWEDGALYLGKYLIDAKINLSGNYTIKDGTLLIADSAFYNCHSLTSITIPDGVTSIGWGAFSDCDRLTSITIPDSVTSIGDWAFYWCKSLTSITIPNSVTSIGVYAFNGCTSLTSITIPNSVTSIGVYAFNGCTSLTSITIGDGVTLIGRGAFRYCDSLTTVYYAGTEEQWNEIGISGSNSDLTNATIYFKGEW